MPKTTPMTPPEATPSGDRSEFSDELPSASGAIPPALAHQFRSQPPPAVPEFSRLPRPRERCPISGASRTWLIEHDAYGHFLFRARQRGKVRGAVFVNVGKLLAYLRKIEAEANSGTATGAQ